MLLKISVANNDGLEILGAMFVNLTTAAGTSSRQMVYLAEGVGDFYMSQEACQDLGVIGRDFPRPQSDGGMEQTPYPLTASNRSRNLGGLSIGTGEVDCGMTMPVANAVPLPHVQRPVLESEQSLGWSGGSPRDLRNAGDGGRPAAQGRDAVPIGAQARLGEGAVRGTGPRLGLGPGERRNVLMTWRAGIKL